jgi:hypothetical protein
LNKVFPKKYLPKFTTFQVNLRYFTQFYVILSNKNKKLLKMTLLNDPGKKTKLINEKWKPKTIPIKEN